MKWDTGSSGSIDVSKVWADGSDSITALAAHNNFLIIFGKRQILVYQGASDPATMSLADTVVGIGCIARDSVQSTGSDLLFLSDSGVRSFRRTIQEKSIPITDISKNVRSTLDSFVLSEVGHITSVYSPEDAFYLLQLPTSEQTYCFDTRTPLENGAYRVTAWNGINPQCMMRSIDGDLHFGKELGVARYKGYQDNGVTYQMSYFTNYLDFGAPSNLKLLNEGEFNAGVLVNRPNVNASGGGAVVQLGVEAEVNGAPVSIQRMTAQAIVGRTI